MDLLRSQADEVRGAGRDAAWDAVECGGHQAGRNGQDDSCVHEGSERVRNSRLQSQLSHVVTFPDPCTLPAQNAVRRRRVKVEVGQREGEEEVLGGELQAVLAKLEAHVT